MSDIWIMLAVEDALGEAAARKLVQQSGRPFQVQTCLGLRGIGYLKSRIRKLNEAARRVPFLVLADLDTPLPCPADRIRKWLGTVRQERTLLLRFAVMETESWLLAHGEAIAQFLKVSPRLVPPNPEAVPQPKEQLVNLARRSRSRRVREDLVPRPGSTSKVGPGYTGQLVEFIQEHWDAELASQRSPSLSRALKRLRTFELRNSG